MAKTNFLYDIITDVEILLTNKKVFKDDEEHPYVFVCCNGFAKGKHDTAKDPNPNCPDTILMSYPYYRELTPKKIEQIREYRGIGENVPLNYEDVAMKFGKIGKYGFNSEELNLIEKIAHANKVDTWLDVTREGNFRDREEGKEISAKKAMGGFIDALQYEDFAHLTTQEKFMLLKSVLHVL